MNNNSRTRNVSINASAGVVCEAINLILSFVSRTVFIYTLGAEYLGINGLFSNILSILSFAELGIGNAIVFSMYKPLATKDTDKIASLMLLYKKAYNAIGIFIAVAGVCIMPFLPYIIHDKPNVPEDITLLYSLFLSQTVLSYFFIYKKSIITADQKEYVALGINTGIHIVRTACQIAFLYFTHNYIVYLLILMGFTLVDNILTSCVANKMYPILKQKATPLDKKESEEIFRNVRALAVHKLGSVIVNGTDNILVSALAGVTPVGLVSNYVLLNSSCNTILNKILGAFTASVGNLNVDSTPEKKYDVFNKLFFISVWLFGFASVGLYVVAKSFIPTWIGKEYLLDDLTSLGIILEFYVKGVSFAAYTYRTTMGYFVYGKIVPALSGVLNIVLSILMFHWIGLAGIFLATPIARMLTTGIADPVLIYRKAFHVNPLVYYLKYFAFVALFVLLGIICSYCVSLITIGGWMGVVLQILMVTVVFNLLMFVIFFRTKMFRELCQSLKTVVLHRR